MLPTTAAQCCLARQAKVAPKEFPFRQIVPGRSEGTRPMAGRRGATELHKFECGLQTRQRRGPAIAKPRTLDHRRRGLPRIAAIALPGRAKAKDLRPTEVNKLSSLVPEIQSMRISSMPN